MSGWGRVRDTEERESQAGPGETEEGLWVPAQWTDRKDPLSSQYPRERQCAVCGGMCRPGNQSWGGGVTTEREERPRRALRITPV